MHEKHKSRKIQVVRQMIDKEPLFSSLIQTKIRKRRSSSTEKPLFNLHSHIHALFTSGNKAIEVSWQCFNLKMCFFILTCKKGLAYEWANYWVLLRGRELVAILLYVCISLPMAHTAISFGVWQVDSDQIRLWWFKTFSVLAASLCWKSPLLQLKQQMEPCLLHISTQCILPVTGAKMPD